MGASSIYPMWLGRSFAFAMKIWRQGQHKGDEQWHLVCSFAEDLVNKLPPPGTLSEEASNSNGYVNKAHGSIIHILVNRCIYTLLGIYVYNLCFHYHMLIEH